MADMPELPEVETLRRRLNEILPGKTIAQIEVLHSKSFFGQIDQLVGSTVLRVDRRAKILTFHLSNDSYLLTHLKMTGQLIVVNDQQRIGGGHPSADWVEALPNQHTRIQYTFTDQTKLFFNDQRIFGWMKQFDRSALNQEMAKYGPDMIDQAVNVDYLWQQFKRKSVPIKQALMDSAIVAGVGNIYACEALFAAQISPFRTAKSLNQVEIKKLLAVTKKIMWQAIELGGTTFDGKYVHVDGLAGGFQSKLQVYGRAGLPCPVCGRSIQKLKLGGRGTYFCEYCQR